MSDIQQYVGFMLGKEHYGVDIMGVEEIIRLMEITPVPRAAGFVEGIINLRGRIIPVVDLRKRLHVELSPRSDATRIVVMRVESRRLGFIVDKVEEVTSISIDRIEAAPGIAASVQQYVDGVARTDKGMIILLDVLRIFSPDEHLLMSSLK